MEEKSFLPGGKPVIANALANIQYPRESLEKIAAGENPSAFLRPARIEPTWGLLYSCADGMGFFVHPSEGQLAILFRASKGDEPEPVNIFIPGESLVSLSFTRPKKPATFLGRMLRSMSSRPQAEFDVSWKGSSGEYSLRFFVSIKADEFERSLAPFAAALRP